MFLEPLDLQILYFFKAHPGRAFEAVVVLRTPPMSLYRRIKRLLEDNLLTRGGYKNGIYTANFYKLEIHTEREQYVADIIWADGHQSREVLTA